MVLFTVGLTVFLAYTAQNNNRGLRLNGGLIVFSPEAATQFYWGSAALSLLVSVLAVWVAIRSLQPAQTIVLGQNEAVLPKASLKGELHSVPYEFVTSVQIREYRGQKVGVIQSKIGEFRVLPMGFESTHEFEEFFKVLHSRISGNPVA